MSKKQRAARLMEAAEKVFYGQAYYSCHAVLSASKSTKEVDKYAGYVGVEWARQAFSFNDFMEYSADEFQLTRELAILMYREAVLAGKA